MAEILHTDLVVRWCSSGVLDRSYLIEVAAHSGHMVGSDRSSGAGADQGACTGRLKVHTDPVPAAPRVDMWLVVPGQNNPH